MPPTPSRIRTVLDGSAGLVCLFTAGWALACMQSGRNGTAEALAGIAASIPSTALLARLWGTLGQARRPARGEEAAMALGPD